MYKQGKYPIVSKKTLAKGIFDIEIYCPHIAKAAKAGQFAQVQAEGFFLRRPISICDINKDKGTIRLVFEVRGHGTDKISELNKGDLVDIIAPLGNGFKVLDKGKKAVCIGGGIGTPPMVGIAKEYGENATVISGFRNAAAVILQEDFKAMGCDVQLCTDDGSAGRKGFVTDAIKDIDYTYVYTCGPEPMLKAVYNAVKTSGQFSFEERMGCGFGACMGCSCETKYGNKRICKDGPVFLAEEVEL